MSKQLINSIKERGRCYFCYKYNYLPKSSNKYQLLINGSQFYPAMLTSINNAQYSIYIIQYIFESGLTATQFINTLGQAKQRGIKVYLFLDAYGSSKLSQNDRVQLNLAGIKTVFLNPLRHYHLIKFLYRDHRKLLVIDDREAFIGGAGICDDYDYPVKHSKSWQDIVLRITGEIAKDCANLAQKEIVKTVPTEKRSRLKKVRDYCSQVSLPFNGQLLNNQGRILVSRSWRHNEIQRAIIHAISKSKKRIWITTPYFVPTNKLRKKLKAAAHRGCDVCLLLPGKTSDHPWVNQIARYIYGRMLNNHIKIFEYQKTFSHAKAILCDDWVCIGSSNLDRWNQKFNHELNIEVHSEKLADELSTFFEMCFNDSIQISQQLWNARSTTQRISEWFWSKVAKWIERLIHNMP